MSTDRARCGTYEACHARLHSQDQSGRPLVDPRQEFAQGAAGGGAGNICREPAHREVVPAVARDHVPHLEAAVSQHRLAAHVESRRAAQPGRQLGDSAVPLPVVACSSRARAKSSGSAAWLKAERSTWNAASPEIARMNAVLGSRCDSPVSRRASQKYESRAQFVP